MENNIDVDIKIIKNLELKEIVPNNINNIIVSYDNNNIILYLPSNMSSDKYKFWKKSQGNIFVDDIKNNKGKYILISIDNNYFIIRLIEDDELDKFKSLNLIDGKIKDYNYMILKQIRNKYNLIQTDRYIEESTDVVQEDIKIIISDDKNNNKSKNISLID